MVNASASLSVENLSLTVGEFALREVTLRLAPGAYGVLLGPTGCGKTLLAETICGLNRPQAGRVMIGDRDITNLDPARRNLGYVPQDYALLPFRTVAENIAFGLEARSLPTAEIHRRVGDLLAMLELTSLRDRRPGRLSGGERQRTALGRALAIKPELLVLDEPLSALDELTGESLMAQMATWQKEFGTTTLHICHRLEEALTMGSSLTVMRDGRIEQSGTPMALMTRPASAFIAEFLRLANRLSGEVADTPAGRRFCVGGTPLAITDCPPGPACGLYPWAAVTVALEPPPPTPGFRTLTMAVAPNSLDHIQPGLVLRGQFNLRLPGFFPQDVWPEGRQVHVQIPETGWHVLLNRPKI